MIYVQALSKSAHQIAAQTGSASIRGRVVAADTGRPLRRARVRVVNSDRNEVETASTDSDGRYHIDGLLGGSYAVSAARSGYLSLEYGQRRPLEHGRMLDLNVGRTAEHVDFSLPRMSVIAGRITDETGDPIEGVTVSALRSEYFEGQRRFVPMHAGTFLRTDDDGEYRVVGLEPGTYIVLASLKETWVAGRKGLDEEMLGYTTTYFPGTTTREQAQRIILSTGERVTGVDFALVPGRTARVSGLAVDAQGMPMAGQVVTMGEELRGSRSSTYHQVATTTVLSDGTFSFRNIPQGEYSVSARSWSASSTTKGRSLEAAILRVTVGGADVEGLVLRANAGWNIAGNLIREDGLPVRPLASGIRIVGISAQKDFDPKTVFGNDPLNGRVRMDGTFHLAGLVGPSALSVSLPDGWTVKTIQFEGRDVTDENLESRGGQQLRDVQIVITNRVTSITTQTIDDRGRRVSDATVILFSQDSSKWVDGSRFLRAVRTDQEGRCRIEGLPPGAYFAVAVDYAEDGVWNEADYLQSVKSNAQEIWLAENQNASASLSISRPRQE